MSFGKFTNDKEPEKTIASSPVGAANSSGKAEAFLGKGTKVVGSLSFTGAVEIDGFVEGEINAQEKLTLGEAAVVNAKVTGTEILVRGTVNGDINASKLLILKRPAKIIGNISSANLSIEEGVIFEGRCTMGGSASSGKPALKTVTPEKIGASA